MRYSLPVAYFLWLISGCGALGLHRFYLGKPGSGVLWIFTGGLGMVGSIYDFFTLPRQVEEANIRYQYREALASGAAQLGYPPQHSRPAERKESAERVILRVAKKNKGLVTPGEVALEGDIPLEDAKKALDKLAAAGHVEMRVRSSGVVVYVFPEFASGADEFVV